LMSKLKHQHADACVVPSSRYKQQRRIGHMEQVQVRSSLDTELLK
jgi:hypothetical protein